MSDEAAGPYRAPDDHAIVVGINRYQPGIDELKGAVNDAKLFCEWLISPDGGGLDPKHVKQILSPTCGPFTPGYGDIGNELNKYFAQNLTTGLPIGRRLYLFMAGHGVAPPHGNDCSLVMADSPVTFLYGLPGVAAADIVWKQPLFREVVLFMACCRDVNGQAAHFTGLPAPGMPLPDSSYLYALAVRWSAKAIERSLPHPLDPAKGELWQSIFCHSLLKGLKHAFDESNRITSFSLKNFVKKQVQELLLNDNRAPDFDYDENNPQIVFKARDAAAAPTSGLVPIEIVLPVAGADVKVLDGETFTDLDLVFTPNGAGVLKTHLKPGLYAFRLTGGPSVPVRVLGEPVRVAL